MYKKPTINYNITKKEWNSLSGDQILKEVMSGNLYNVKRFIHDGPTSLNVNDNSNGNTLIHNILGIPDGQINESAKLYLIKYCFNQGASVTKPNNINLTPLHIACHKQYRSIVNFLLKHGADPNSLDSQSKNPLHYLVQPPYHQCRRGAKVGDLIPKQSKRSPKPTESLLDLSTLIIDILTTEYFGLYSQHIKFTTNNVNNIYPTVFNSKIEQLKKQIAVEISDRSKQPINKQQIITNVLSSGIQDVTKTVTDKLYKAIKPIDIAPNNKGFLSVLSYDSVYDELNESKINIQNIKTGLNQTFEMIRNVQTQLESNYKSFKSHLYEILMHNINLKVNNKNKAGAIFNSYISDNDLRNILSDTELPVHNININSFDVYNNTAFQILFDDQSPNVKAYRLERHDLEDIDKIRTSRNRNPQLIDLTVDGVNRWVGDNPPVPANQLRVSYTQVAGLNNVYFISVLEVCVTNIKTYVTQIEQNFTALFNHIDNDYFFEIYHRIGSEIYSLVLNIFQHLLLMNHKRFFIKRKLTMLYNSIYSLLPDVNQHKYEFSQYYMSDYINAMIEYEDKIANLTPQIYSSCIKLINVNMNQIIEYVNNKSSRKFIKGYFGTKTNPVPFITTTTHELNNFFDRPLDKFKQLEPLFENYVMLNDGLNIASSENKLNSMKKKIIESYVPQINCYNYSTYYVRPGFNYTGLTQFSIINGTQPVTPALNNRGLEAGYLINVIQADNDRLLNILKPVCSNTVVQSVNNSVVGNINLVVDRLIKQRSEAAEATVGENLDIHFRAVKFLLVQHMIDLFRNNTTTTLPNSMITQINTVKDKLFNYVRQSSVKDVDAELALYTIVGRITDQIITHNIKSEIVKSVHRILNTEITGGLTSNKPHLEQFVPVHRDDRGFSLNFNALIDELIDVFMTYNAPIQWDDEYHKLLFTSKLMEEDVNNSYKNEFMVSSIDYFSPISTNMCVTVDLSIIDSLIDKGCKINKQDYNRQSPIFYAVDLMHKPLVSKLINRNAFITSIKNINNQTPLDVNIKQITSHINLILQKDKPIFYDLYYPIYDILRQKIVDKVTNRYNVIKGLDVLFPQTLSMIDNYFYTKVHNLKNLKDNIPLINNIDDTVVNGDYALNLLTNLENQQQNKDYRSDDIKTHLQLHIKTFLINMQTDNDNSVVNFYNKLYDTTVGNLHDVFNEKGLDNYQLYIQMWRSYLTDSVKYNNIFNVNATISGYLQSWLNYFKQTKDVNKTLDFVKSVNNTYYLQFLPHVVNFFELPEQLDSNYMLKDMFGIMEHSLSKTVFSNLYTGVLKTVAQYTVKTHKEVSNVRSQQDINHNIGETLLEFVSNGKLQEYVVKQMPLFMMKTVLSKYDDDFDESSTTTVDQMFNKITQIIRDENTAFVTDPNSSLVENLEKYVYPYYKEVITDIIIALYGTTVNYLNFIKNQANMTSILEIMLEKMKSELNS